MKDKKLQMIINMVVVINIILILALGYYLMLKSKYTVKYIKKLSEKSMQCYNYIIEIQSEDIQTKEKYHIKIFQKEKSRREDIISENITRWEVNDVQIFEDRTENERVYSEWKTEQKILYGDNNWWRYVNNEKFKYIGKEKYNNIKCVVLYYEDAEMQGTAGVWTRLSYKIWIDEERGHILKQETYKDGELSEITTYTIQTNCVTDKEIALPDLKDFTKIKGNN